MGHKFGMVINTGLSIGGVDLLGNLISDLAINSANSDLRSGRAKEGVNWFDNWRKVPPHESIVIIRGGAYFRRRPYRATTFDIYREGARKLAGK